MCNDVNRLVEERRKCGGRIDAVQRREELGYNEEKKRGGREESRQAKTAKMK